MRKVGEEDAVGIPLLLEDGVSLTEVREEETVGIPLALKFEVGAEEAVGIPLLLEIDEVGEEEVVGISLLLEIDEVGLFDEVGEEMVVGTLLLLVLGGDGWGEDGKAWAGRKSSLVHTRPGRRLLAVKNSRYSSLKT